MDESQVRGCTPKCVSARRRASLFVWLEKESGRKGGIFTRKQLEDGFTFEGQMIALVGPTGIASHNMIWPEKKWR